MKVPVINIKGKTTGREVELSNKVFGIEPNDHAVYLDVCLLYTSPSPRD